MSIRCRRGNTEVHIRSKYLKLSKLWCDRRCSVAMHENSCLRAQVLSVEVYFARTSLSRVMDATKTPSTHGIYLLQKNGRSETTRHADRSSENNLPFLLSFRFCFALISRCPCRLLLQCPGRRNNSCMFENISISRRCYRRWSFNF